MPKTSENDTERSPSRQPKPLFQPNLFDVEDVTSGLLNDSVPVPSKRSSLHSGLPPEVAELSLKFRALRTSVAILSSPNFTVYLVGTNHMLYSCQEDATYIVKNAKPNILVVELCPARACSCPSHKNSIFQVSPDGSLHYLWRSVSELGLFAGLIFYADVYKESRAARGELLDYGGEMTSAVKEAKKLKDCEVLLGDRPINVTFRRQASILNGWTKLKLLIQVGLSICFPFMRKWLLLSASRMIYNNVMAYLILVLERDIYLTYSIQAAASKKVSNAERTTVVAVVGEGHMSGILSYWGKVSANIIPTLLNSKATYNNNNN